MAFGFTSQGKDFLYQDKLIMNKKNHRCLISTRLNERLTLMKMGHIFQVYSVQHTSKVEAQMVRWADCLWMTWPHVYEGIILKATLCPKLMYGYTHTLLVGGGAEISHTGGQYARSCGHRFGEDQMHLIQRVLAHPQNKTSMN